MAEEKSRTRSVRRITAPGDTGTYIDLKIIDDITFKEEKPPYQEWVLKFQNNPDDAARTVRVVEVGDAKLKVERIDTLDTEESTGRRQESIWSFLNDKDPPVHLETHETTIYASDGNGNITDTGTWIKVQRIDKIEFEDEADEVRNQESVWQLDNPDKSDDKDDYKELTPPVRTWDNSTINPPWRLDPFQTITDCSFGRYMLILHSGNKISAIPMASIKNPVGNVVVNKTSASNWGSYNFSTQLKLAINSHVAILGGLKINANGDISLASPAYKYVAYNTQKSLLAYAESPIDDCAYFNPIFNGSGSNIYDDVGGRYTISQTGTISFTSQAFVKRDSTIAFPTANGQWYGPTTGNGNGFGSPAGVNGGLYTYDQYAQLTPNPGFVFRTTWGGPGVSDMFELWADNGATVDHFPVYSNNGTLDKVDIQTATISFTYSREDVAGDGTTWRIVRQMSTSSYGPLAWTLDWYFGEDENLNPVDDRTESGETSYIPIPTLHLDNNPTSGMFIEWTEFPGRGANTPFDGRYKPPVGGNSLYPINIAANGKHILYRYYLNDSVNGNYKINIDRTDYTDVYTQALGLTDLSGIDFILFDIKKSDIDKLK